MREDLISFETAKLAKDKGFDWDCVNYFQDSHRAGVHKINNINNKIIDELHQEDKYCIIFFATPTQSLLQKWLREKHKIHIDIQPFYYKGDFISWNLKIHNTYFKEKYKTHEEALEIGLYQALLLI